MVIPMKKMEVTTLDLICDTERSLEELQKRIDKYQEEMDKLKFVQRRLVANFDIKTAEIEFDASESLAFETCYFLKNL